MFPLVAKRSPGNTYYPLDLNGRVFPDSHRDWKAAIVEGRWEIFHIRGSEGTPERRDRGLCKTPATTIIFQEVKASGHAPT